MHHEPLPISLCLHFPELLQPDAVHLGSCSELESFLELSTQLPAAAFGEEGVLAVQLHARLVRVGLLALAIDAQVPRSEAFHRAAFIEDFCGGETGEDLDPQRFGLFAEPAAYVAEADDVVPMVLEARRQHPVGGPQ